MIGYLLKKRTRYVKIVQLLRLKKPHNRHKTINCTRKRVSSYEMILVYDIFRVACLAGSNKQESTDKHILAMKIISIL